MRLNMSTPAAGFCRFVEWGWEGDCARGEQGTWSPRRYPRLASLQGCVARCRDCARCNYVSFTPPLTKSDLGDCSWYHRCATGTGALSTKYDGFVTVQVRPLALEVGEVK